MPAKHDNISAMNTGIADDGMCKAATDSRKSAGQHKTVLAGLGNSNSRIVLRNQ